MSSLRNEARKLGTNSVLYLIPSLLVRGLGFLLTPLYTRNMSVDEYGVVSLSNTVSALLGVALGFAAASSITRLHHEHTDDGERRRYYGTLTVFTLVVPTALGGILHVMGAAGMFEHVIRSVPFTPFLALALWTAVLSLQSTIPMGLYATIEQPGRIAVMNIVIAVSQAIATVYYVVVRHEGAVGALRGGLVAAGCSAVMSLALMWPHISLRLRWSMLKQALFFSLPLVPHLLSNWVLSVSDRLILERSVDNGELGRYALGYLFSFVVGLVASAVSNAITPIITRQLKADPRAPQVPRLGTIAIAAMAFAALGAAALANDAIRIMSPPSYHTAGRVVPWVVLGALMQGVYIIWSQGTWFSMKTGALPAVTAVGAVVNVGLNVVFVPRFGIMAAAVNTAVAYVVLALLHGWLAHRLFPIAWEYGRWGLILAVTVSCFFLSAAVPASIPPPLAIATRLAIVVVVFPAMLVAVRVFPLDELRRFRRPAST